MFKDKSTKVKHEFLVAALGDSNKGEVLLIERRVQDSSAKTFVMRRSRTKPLLSDSDPGKQDTLACSAHRA